MDGYIPYTEKEKKNVYNKGFKTLKESLKVAFHKTDKEAETIVQELKKKQFTIKEIGKYMKKKYGYENAESLFVTEPTKKGTVGSVNNYIKQRFNEHSYSYYISLKFVDYMAVEIGFFCIILFCFSYINDTKKDIYELLHTKPIKPASYVFGKVIGSTSVMIAVIILISFLFNFIVMIHANKAHLPYEYWDLWRMVGVMLFPVVFSISAIYLFLSILCKNSLPAVPIILLYIIYSNMGTIGDDGIYGYSIKPVSLIVRFADLFLENILSARVVLNQFCILAFALLCCLLSTYLWKRRRV